MKFNARAIYSCHKNHLTVFVSNIMTEAINDCKKASDQWLIHLFITNHSPVTSHPFLKIYDNQDFFLTFLILDIAVKSSAARDGKGYYRSSLSTTVSSSAYNFNPISYLHGAYQFVNVEFY
jgi:hypothetical protein